MIKVTCLGGAGSVTGSNYLVENSKGIKILVDCGLFQGGKQMESRNWMDWGFDPKQIDVLFLTHAHIDHSGRIPKLVKDGFKGKIITSPPTAELCEIMLLDAAHIQEMDAEWQTRKNNRQGKRGLQPLYTTEDAQKSLQFFSPVERDQRIDVQEGIKARLRNAGHILGSSILELWIEEDKDDIKIVFSGDIGKQNQLIIKDPQEMFTADHLFVESTYGNRLHRSFEDSKNELAEAVQYAVSNREKVIIPAFAVERTQEIIYILGELQRSGQILEIPIYLDSPLAIKATEIFRKNKKYYDDAAIAIVDQGIDPFDLPNLHYTPSTKESMAINESSEPAIIIAGSGMCTAGRVKHHLKHNIWRPGASIVIVGFQAQGTTGRKIVEGNKWIKLFRENVAVEAKVFTIGGFSAHADEKDLLAWIKSFSESKPKIFVIHGESISSETLAEKIRINLGMETHVPKWREPLILKPKDIVREEVPEKDYYKDTVQAMQNTMLDLEKKLDRLKKQINKKAEGEEITNDDLDRLKYIQEEIQFMLSQS